MSAIAAQARAYVTEERFFFERGSQSWVLQWRFLKDV